MALCPAGQGKAPGAEEASLGGGLCGGGGQADESPFDPLAGLLLGCGPLSVGGFHFASVTFDYCLSSLGQSELVLSQF